MNYLPKLIAATALLFAGGAGADASARVPQETYKPPVPKSQQAFQAMDQGDRNDPRQARSMQAIRLPPLGPDERDELQQPTQKRGQPRLRKIGVHRNLRSFFSQEIGSAELDWSLQSHGGALGVISVSSAGAGALRTRFVFRRLPAGTSVHYSGADSSDIHTLGLTQEEISRRGNPVWSPVTAGETQYIEIYVVDAAARAQLDFELTAISHIAASDFLQTPKYLSDVGAAASCNLDVNCATSPLVQQMADSVAKIIVSDMNGTFLCTGTLLNDTDGSTFIPYFYTATHCVGPQEEASSMQSFWFFESTACNSGTAGPFQTRYNGAQLLHADVTTDVSLLRLNEQPPAGAVFSGWDPSPLNLLDEVTGIHHPSGDLKKLSAGSYLGVGEPNTASGDLFYQVIWNSGITESGSSGSGLFTMDGENFYLHGGLWGGSASCFNPRGEEYYSRFARSYSALQVYLDPTAPESGWWRNPEESGRGLSIDIRSGRLFMAVALYDETGRATWFVSSGAMSSATDYAGDLVKYENGQTLTGSERPASLAGSVGTITLHFSAKDKAVLTLPGGTFDIERFRFSGGSRADGLIPETGWWLNQDESGRGFFIDIQGDTLFMAGYMYAADGNPVWYLAIGLLDGDNVLEGNWTLYGFGQTLTGPDKLPVVINDNIGQVRLQFLSTTTARLTLPDMRTMELTRFRF